MTLRELRYHIVRLLQDEGPMTLGELMEHTGQQGWRVRSALADLTCDCGGQTALVTSTSAPDGDSHFAMVA